MTERVLTRRAAERLVEAATAAPSMHNSQPWRFVVRPADHIVEIYADPARTLRHGDPHGRAVHIACGAALFNLRLAIANAGAEPVARLLPQPRNPLLLASVRLGGPYRSQPWERELHEAIEGGPASRRPFAHATVPSHLLAALAEAAMLEGATLRTLGQPDVWRILQLTAAADHQLRSDPGYLAELAAFTTGPGHPAPPGLEPSQQLVAVCTGSDDRYSWLRAGQAMQRVLLLATHRGLRVSPLTPVLDVPDAPLRRDPAFEGEWPEMILRIGYGPPGAPAPRRPIWQTLRVVGPPAPAGHGPLEAPPALIPN
jgi:nitroreductase